MTTNMLTNHQATAVKTEHVRYGQLWRVGLIAVVVAVIANLVVWAIGSQLVTVPPEFLPMSNPVPTIMFTALGVIAATIAFALVGRFTRQPSRVYTIVATVALILSLIPNVMMLVDPASAPFPGANLGNVTVLMLQHVVAAVVAVWVLTTRGVETRPVSK